jgi:ABC-2 type transport system ATP-binding protein
MSLAPREQSIVFENVSKFYGEVLGINKVDLSIPPGITSLVGPNGSGKTTLMNLLTGLIQPSRGRIDVLGISPGEPERLFHRMGYCTQFDTFPRAVTGFQFVESYLRIHGYGGKEAGELAREALEMAGLVEAAHRKVAGYSKGMRQRIKLAQAISHRPAVLVLDEPLNGLDPLARAEMIRLFQELAERGQHIIVSSHILHEVDLISDCVIMLNEGYVVAEGDIREVRGEMETRPLQILLRCERPERLAMRLFEQDHVVEVRIHDDRAGLLVSTRDSDRFYLVLNEILMEEGLAVEHVSPADENVDAVYQYLIGQEGESS